MKFLSETSSGVENLGFLIKTCNFICDICRRVFDSGDAEWVGLVTRTTK